jgi:hypothetical protein
MDMQLSIPELGCRAFLERLKGPNSYRGMGILITVRVGAREDVPIKVFCYEPNVSVVTCQ